MPTTSMTTSSIQYRPCGCIKRRCWENENCRGGTVLPQDRFFFRYSYLDNVRYSNGGQHLNRYVPGFEKSFGDGIYSVEVRAPLLPIRSPRRRSMAIRSAVVPILDLEISPFT